MFHDVNHDALMFRERGAELSQFPWSDSFESGLFRLLGGESEVAAIPAVDPQQSWRRCLRLPK